VHKRAIKVWDADPEVVERWVRFLDAHSEGGVGMRVVRWERAPVGIGREALRKVEERLMLRKGGDSIKRLGEKIVEAEGGVPAKEEVVKATA
jgi:small subunit ribosomal protein S10